MALSLRFILASQSGWSRDRAVKVGSVGQMLAGRLEESTIQMVQAAWGTTDDTYIALAPARVVDSPVYPYLHSVLHGCA